MSTYMSIHMSAYMPIRMSRHMSIHLSLPKRPGGYPTAMAPAATVDCRNDWAGHTGLGTR